MDSQKFGPNDVHVEGDLVFTIVHGVASLDASRRYLELVAEVTAKHGRVVMLTDVTKGFGLSPETRRYTTEWGKTHTVAASAVFGASAPARAMLLFVTRAMSLVSNYHSNVRFFAAEAEARDWLDEYRLPEFRQKRPK